MAGFRGGFGAIASLGTAAGLADIAQDVFGFEEQLIRLNIQAKGEADIDRIRTAVERLSLDLGMTKTQVIAAGTALTNRLGATGATAAKIEVLTRAMVASGASAEDLALLALKLDKAFGLRSAEEMREGLSALIEVGKQGSVPLAEMAAVVAQSGSQFAKFGKTGKAAAAELGALIQVAVAGGEAGGFGSAAEAGTGLRAFISQLEQSEDKLRAVGVQVREMGDDGQQHLRPMAEILADIRRKNLVNRRGFTRLFGSVQARDFLAVLLEQEDAVRNLTAAGRASNAVQEDSATFMQSNAGQMRKAWQGLRAEVEQLFTPERTEEMVAALKALGQAVGFVIDNWKLFLAAFVAIKAVGIGRALFKWARAAKELAGGAGMATRAMRSLGGTTEALGGGAGVAGGRGASTLQKAAGGALAFGFGFEIGQLIEEETGVGTSIGKALGFNRTEKARREFQRDLRRRSRERTTFAQAMQDLTDAQAISEEGVLDPKLVRSLRLTQVTGRKKTRLEEAAQVALAFRTEEGKALATSADLGIGGFIRAATMTPDQRQSEAQDRTAFDERLVAAIADLATRPIEVKIGADAIATAVQNAPKTQRSPAP